MEKAWKELSREVKQKLIEAINERSSYEWKADFWAGVSFKLIPPVLKLELEKELKKLKKQKKL